MMKRRLMAMQAGKRHPGETRIGTGLSGIRVRAFQPYVILLLRSDSASKGPSEKPGNYTTLRKQLGQGVGSAAPPQAGHPQAQGLRAGRS